ncbi:MAG TPA: hypothetical protein VMU14_14185 [Acidimicrobiales bacterium]|nr:hypothetical protein [Acidimicrobiales bacterium]
MLRFEWNALRPGDHVLVHDPDTAVMTLIDGVVTSVDTHKRLNGVGIRVGAPRADTAILWPSHLVVHRDPSDETESCWRCQELAGRTAPPLHEPSKTAALAAAAPRPEPAVNLIGPTAAST